ncbi:hypothetical protein EG832_02130 [bacterium]|nr:hypothetical protein [bacterium]
MITAENALKIARDRRRGDEYIFIRHAVASVLREAGFSLKKAGKVICRDHSTVKHSIEVHTGLIQTRHELYGAIFRDIQDCRHELIAIARERIQTTSKEAVNA